MSTDLCGAIDDLYNLVASHLFYKPHTHALKYQEWMMLCLCSHAILSVGACVMSQSYPTSGNIEDFLVLNSLVLGLPGWVLRIVHPLQAQFFCLCSCILYLEYFNNKKLSKLYDVSTLRRRGTKKDFKSCINIRYICTKESQYWLYQSNDSIFCKLLENITGVATAL